MKLILKDGFIYIVNSTEFDNNKIVAEVETRYVDSEKLKEFSYRINNKPYTPLVNKSIPFTREDYKNGYIDLEIKAKKGKELEYYRSDRIPVTFAVVFGKQVNEAYPEVIRHLLDRMDRMDVVLTNIIDAMAEVDKKGDLF